MYLLHHFGFGENTVRIGLNRLMARKRTNGRALVQSGSVIRTIPFLVDYPEKLNRPSKDLVKDVMVQLIRLGHHQVESIEIDGKRQRHAYRICRLEPELVAKYPLHGIDTSRI